MLLADVGTRLGANIASLTIGTNLFYGRMQETPDNAVCLYESTSMVPVYTLGQPAAAVERPRLQVHVRNTSYATGRELADEIWLDLNQVVGATLSGTHYHLIEASHSPTFLMRDENNRWLFNMNFDVMKDPPS